MVYTDELELEKLRASGKRTGGGSIFSNTSSSSIPSELSELVAPQQTITKLVLSTKTSLNAANLDYDKLTDPSVKAPTPPVHAARLNGLLNKLANAEGAVAEVIKARKVLIESLEKILSANQTALAADEVQLAKLSSRRTEIDNKKKDVEDSIMRGFASNSNPSTPAGPIGSPGVNQTPVPDTLEVSRPEVEALTPPVRAQPTPHNAAPELDLDAPNGNGTSHPQPPPAGSDLLSSLSSNSYSYGRPASAASGSSAKRRKLNSGDDFPDLGGEDAMEDLDPDVAAMLRQDSGNGT